MADKKQKLMKAAAESVRAPRPSRLVEAEPLRTKDYYKVIGVSVLPSQASWIDRVAADLKKAGDEVANKSSVVREAISRLQEDLQNKTPAEILADFRQRKDRRVR